MAVDQPFEKQEAWINQVVEEALEPERPICDAHHHFWHGKGRPGGSYLLEDLQRDTGTGHNISQTVFLECHSEYKKEGPKHLRSVGEVEFVAEIAAQSALSSGATVAAIVGNADVSLGDAVEEVLVALDEAGDGRFRGIRYSTAQDTHPPLKQPSSAPMDDANYLNGVRRVGALGYSYDAMIYHPQLAELVEVARACPDTPIVINHLGGILGTGPYKDQREQILASSLVQLKALAACPNTFLKLGGIGMPMMGLRWDKQAIPPTSIELSTPWQEPIQAMIDMFGADRCMFESNYPVDKRGAGYAVLWNAYKLIAADYSEADKTNLFHDTAARAYRIPEVSKT